MDGIASSAGKHKFPYLQEIRFFGKIGFLHSHNWINKPPLLRITAIEGHIIEFLHSHNWINKPPLLRITAIEGHIIESLSATFAKTLPSAGKHKFPYHPEIRFFGKIGFLEIRFFGKIGFLGTE
ncbi:MAG: hypothetical protein B6247_22880 [Candidatus Parabeggiatoa sp. nov. 2]|nr:MAG: hypothetical protein B6247_22880 [Beggiatoa sp. 4572_84]